MLELQREIRLQRKIVRNRDSANRDKYTKLFEPVTKTLTSLKSPPDATAATTATPATASLISIDEKKEDVKKEEEPLVHLDDLEEIVGPGELYTRALAEIPQRLRDDGKLGLDTKNHMIGDWTYNVAGDRLIVRNREEEDSTIIDDYNVWCLLLTFNPKKTRLETQDEDGQLLPFVRKYAYVVDRLGLMARYERLATGQKRVKYNLLRRVHEGSGFLFTTRPPTVIHPDTVVVPSDPAGLMEAIALALAEFRAGNTSMRNVVVPLAAEAKRMGILPKNLLSNDEKTWVFA